MTPAERLKYIGLLVGLWLGFVWVIWGFSEAVLVALAGAVGYFIGRVVSGDLDVARLGERFSAR